MRKQRNRTKDRKRALLLEKEKITKELKQLDPTKTEWTEIRKDSFDFALLASKRFDKDSPEDKKIVFRTVGSNQIILDQKLLYQLRYLFFTYKKGIEQTNEESKRLVLKNRLADQSKLKNL